MSTSHIRYETHGRIAVVHFDRPEKLNALTLDMYEALGASFERAQPGPENVPSVLVPISMNPFPRLPAAVSTSPHGTART
jgi:1,4-dihydroxy-2-naphthoyl-CoA synthase